MPEVSADEAVALPGILVRCGARGSRRLPRPASRPAGTPCRRRLGGPQGAITQEQEPGDRGRDQEGTDNGRHQGRSTDGRQEPEAEYAEQRDEASGEEGQDAPRAQVAVPVEVQGDFSSGDDSEEQHRPRQGGVLVAVEGLGGEIAGHAVHRHGNQGQDHLPRQRSPPPRAFGLDSQVSDRRVLGDSLRLPGDLGAVRGHISRLAGTQALLLHGFVGCVDVPDQDRRVDGRDGHHGLLVITDRDGVNTMSVTHFWHVP